MDDYPTKVKVFGYLSIACLMFGGCIGMKNDWTLYYYVFSPFSTAFVWPVIRLFADWLGVKNIRTCDAVYSGFVILMCASMLFHRDTWYLIGRIVPIFGATIAWLLSMDTADKN